MSEGCVEDCAPAKDYQLFELKKGINLPDMPRFPLQEFQKEMRPKVRQIVVAVYVSKIVDALQGVYDDRQDFNRPQVAEYLQMSKSKVYSMVQTGVIPHLKIGRNVRVKDSDLQKWLEMQKVMVSGDVWYIPKVSG